MSDEDSATLITAIIGNEGFTDLQKEILRGLLPNAIPGNHANATSMEIHEAAEGLRFLGPNYHDIAEALLGRRR
jgi:hypothetical protein